MSKLTAMPEQIANVQGAASVGLAITTWVVEMEPYFQFAATIVAIGVGVTAMLWNVEKWRIARRERLLHDASHKNKGSSDER